MAKPQAQTDRVLDVQTPGTEPSTTTEAPPAADGPSLIADDDSAPLTVESVSPPAADAVDDGPKLDVQTPGSTIEFAEPEVVNPDPPGLLDASEIDATKLTSPKLSKQGWVMPA